MKLVVASASMHSRPTSSQLLLSGAKISQHALLCPSHAHSPGPAFPPSLPASLPPLHPSPLFIAYSGILHAYLWESERATKLSPATVERHYFRRESSLSKYWVKHAKRHHFRGPFLSHIHHTVLVTEHLQISIWYSLLCSCYRIWVSDRLVVNT